MDPALENEIEMEIKEVASDSGASITLAYADMSVPVIAASEPDTEKRLHVPPAVNSIF